MNGMECFLKYHSHEFFGLSRTDSNKLYQQPLHAWKAPDENAIRRNAHLINRIRRSEETDTLVLDNNNNAEMEMQSDNNEEIEDEYYDADDGKEGEV